MFLAQSLGYGLHQMAQPSEAAASRPASLSVVSIAERSGMPLANRGAYVPPANTERPALLHWFVGQLAQGHRCSLEVGTGASYDGAVRR